ADRARRDAEHRRHGRDRRSILRVAIDLCAVRRASAARAAVADVLALVDREDAETDAHEQARGTDAHRDETRESPVSIGIRSEDGLRWRSCWRHDLVGQTG